MSKASKGYSSFQDVLNRTAEVATSKRPPIAAKGVTGYHSNRIRVIPAPNTFTFKGKPRVTRNVRSSAAKLDNYWN